MDNYVKFHALDKDFFNDLLLNDTGFGRFIQNNAERWLSNMQADKYPADVIASHRFLDVKLAQAFAMCEIISFLKKNNPPYKKYLENARTDGRDLRERISPKNDDDMTL